MRPNTVASLALVFITFLSTGNAQETDRRPRPAISFEQVLKREDADHDGKISQTEFKGPGRLFTRMDRNGDGQVTKQEFLARPNFKPSAVNMPDDVQMLRDVVFGQGGGRDLKMHIVMPKQAAKSPMPVYIWVHGGGWQGGTKEGGVGQLIPLARSGFVTATIEYRLTGEAAFPAQIEDCKCAIRYLRAHAEKYKIDKDRVAVGGSSAGGHLAALLGTSGGVAEFEGTGGWADQPSNVNAVVDLYGPTDILRFVTTPGFEGHNRDGSPESRLLGGGVVAENLDGIKRVNPITYVDQNDPPFLIIHGTADRTVPLNQSQRMHDALKSSKIDSTLHIIQGAGHGGPGFAEPKIREMQKSFLMRVLREPPMEQQESIAQP
ncbi:Carboxylesterase NlhH [Rubripirellula lacrimiformis]|uniref:Carboxylesterase NlhH n=1 Tax=Rubripirellula lacrimiformis TaxID=1930273 RepID=A0A517NBR9_9BACT|nr:alpha/beta fold hydrolase [Rubripirellula lacrimiformis]QDT04582.1 Carboxylesterase NlhH [Rubripirellula lacrimiformis]